MEKTRVALYIRVSTEKQAKEGDSLEAQENALLEYCIKNNYEIIDKYIDGGESGQKFQRTNLQRLLHDIKNRKIDLILITKLDRWFRNISDFYKTMEILKANKVGWKTIWEEYDTTTASGEFWLNMSLSMGQMEAKRTSERIKEVFNYKINVLKEVVTSPTFGYKVVDKHMVIDEMNSCKVIETYKQYIKNNCLKETIRWYTATYEPISYYKMKRMLRNSAYIGKYKRDNGDIIEDFCPPIMDEELWQKVQNLLDKNLKDYNSFIKNPRRKEDYLFSGMCKCGSCGKNLSGKYNTKGIKYYVCHSHESQIKINRCDNAVNIQEKHIEDYILTNIHDLLNKKLLNIKNLSAKTKEVKDIRPQLITKQKKLVELYLNNAIDIDYYKEQYNLLKIQIENLEKKLKPKEERIDNLVYDKILNADLLKTYDTWTINKKRRLWISVIKKIEITKDREVKVSVY